MSKHIKEALIYLIVALSSLFSLGYAVHMLVGGLVTPEAEKKLIIIACLSGACVIALMAYDVIRRRMRMTENSDRNPRADKIDE
ncbi:MAG: hypothetical protein V4443_03670 [Pseudomonadota bacterium]